jgi:uncharacterized protein (TIGR03435 family)
MKAISIGILVVTALCAQQQSGKPEFEAVSVKPANPELSNGGTARMVNSPPGRYVARNHPLGDLVRSAWKLNQNQLVGGPNWTETAGWDIDARYPAGADLEQQRQMMQAMLADRFRLVVRSETRTLPTYALTIAKGGTKLREDNGPAGMSAGPRLIRYRSGTMGELASQLSGYLGRQVIDLTGLTGHYAIDLSFAPVDPAASENDAPADSLPSIFQALQEQAGLKLDSTRGPVEVLAIDRAEKPSSN